jgi:hypothetical protein
VKHVAELLFGSASRGEVLSVDLAEGAHERVAVLFAQLPILIAMAAVQSGLLQNVPLIFLPAGCRLPDKRAGRGPVSVIRNRQRRPKCRQLCRGFRVRPAKALDDRRSLGGLLQERQSQRISRSRRGRSQSAAAVYLQYANARERFSALGEHAAWLTLLRLGAHLE